MIRLLTLALLLIASPLLAQPRGGGMGAPAGGTVTGTVLGGDDGAPLARATVSLRNPADSSAVTGILTERDGTFRLEGVRPGRYLLRVSYAGYQRYHQMVTIAANAIEPVGTVRLALAQGTDVTVEAKRNAVEQQIDRTVYRADDILAAQGGSATDLLRNIPAVEVDSDNEISLRGSQNITIMLNGRPLMMNATALAAFLQSFPADAIDRIEIIPNPSAKYDPDGLGGIINIVLKQQSRRGFNGAVGGSISNYLEASGNLSLGYGDGGLNAYTNYSLLKSLRRGYANRFSEERFSGLPARDMTQRNDDTNSGLSHTVSASVDYTFEKEHSVSANAYGSISNRERNSTARYSYTDPSTGNLTESSVRTSVEEPERKDADLRVGYKWTRQTARHELSVEGRVSFDENLDIGSYEQAFTFPDTSIVVEPRRQNSTTLTSTRTWAGQLDYVHPLGDWGRIETGYKGELSHLETNQSGELWDVSTETFMPDSASIDNFNYDQTIHAGYGMVGFEEGMFAAQAGARLEGASTDFFFPLHNSSFNHSYFSVFPSAYFSYRPTEESQFKVSYSKRINRPRLRQLNPFSPPSDANFRQVGNPNLQPEYTHSYEATASWYPDGFTATLSPYYRHTVDAITWYESTDSTGFSTLTFENLLTRDNIGADLTLTGRVPQLGQAMVYLGVYQTETDGSNIESDLASNAFGWMTRLNLTWNVTPWLDFNVSWFYRAPQEYEGGRMGAHQRADLALQGKFLDEKLRVGLRLNDPLAQQGFSIYRDRGDYTLDAEMRSATSRSVTLNVTYSFGEADSKKRRGEQGPRDDGGGPGGMDMGF